MLTLIPRALLVFGRHLPWRPAMRLPALWVTLLCVFVALGPAGWAEEAPDASNPPEAVSQPDAISQIETRLFSATYASEPQEDRLKRLEEFVYGEPQAGDLAERQRRLEAQLKGQTAASSPVAGPNDAGVPDEANEPVPLRKPDRPDATDYPTITAMERKVFGLDYRQEPVQQRLARLEKAVFGSVHEDMELVDRVDRLQTKVPASAILYDPQEALYNPNRPQRNQGSTPYSQQRPPYQTSFGDLYLKLDELERGLLNGESNSGRMITERLDLLERVVYGSTFSSDSLDTRLNRLNQAYQRRVGQSGNGDGTQSRPPQQSRPGYAPQPYGAPGNLYSPPGSQWGQPYSPYRSQGEPAPSPNREVQVNQQSTWSTPYGGGQSRSSRSYVTSAPGTVIIQETTEYPGVITSPGYGYPGGVVTPLGVPITGAGGVGMPLAPSVITPMGAPAYISDAVGGVGQVLNQLEMAATGVMNPSLPVETRLSQLEARYLGQPQTGVSTAQRLNNLQRVIQLQSMGRSGVSGGFGFFNGGGLSPVLPWAEMPGVARPVIQFGH